jgi:hypothetical protein
MPKVQLKILSTGLHPKAQRAVAKKHLNLLLEKLPEGSTAYVAGGAPRDWHHGWGCRDIDIFFSVPLEHRDKVADMLTNEHGSFKRDESNYGYGVEGHGIIHSIHEYEATKYSPRAKSTEYTKVQLIQTKQDALEVIKNFPISLSRIWMDKDGNIECDLFYARTYNSRIIHEMNESHGWNYVYLDKILGRFPMYAFAPMYYNGSRPAEEQLDIGF